MSGTGEDAAQACRQLSSRADEIAAGGEAVAKVLANMPGLALFNPSNYAAKNEVQQRIKNVTNIDMSDNDIMKITNACSNLASQIQMNSIDTSACSTPEFVTAWTKYASSPACLTKDGGCPFPSLSGITQSNVATAHQQCIMSNLMDMVRQRGSASDSAAAALAQQKAENMANNKGTTDICNYVTQDLSSNRLVTMINECTSGIDTEQINEMKGCVPASNVMQSNQMDNFQECISSAMKIDKITDEAETTTKSTAESEQTALGMNLFAMVGIVCIVCLCIAASGGYLYFTDMM